MRFSLLWFVPILVTTSYIALNIGRLPFLVPLFYSKVWGAAQLADKNYLYLPVIGAFLLGIVNFVITLFIKEEDKLFRYLLLATGSAMAILASITVFNIIGLVS